jgi:hypothetical protein
MAIDMLHIAMACTYFAVWALIGQITLARRRP